MAGFEVITEDALGRVRRLHLSVAASALAPVKVEDRGISAQGDFIRALEVSEGAVDASPATGSGPAPPRWKSLFVSLAAIPVSIFLISLYAASHR